MRRTKGRWSALSRSVMTLRWHTLLWPPNYRVTATTRRTMRTPRPNTGEVCNRNEAFLTMVSKLDPHLVGTTTCNYRAVKINSQSLKINSKIKCVSIHFWVGMHWSIRLQGELAKHLVSYCVKIYVVSKHIINFLKMNLVLSVNLDMINISHAKKAQDLATETNYRTFLHEYTTLPTDMNVAWAKKAYGLQSDVSLVVRHPIKFSFHVNEKEFGIWKRIWCVSVF